MTRLLPVSVRRLILALALLAVAHGSHALAQDFHKGLDAFNAGRYGEAYTNWWPLALQGDAKSQASLGFLFYAGKGVPADDAQALVWFGKAAEAGQPTAQFFMGLHYYYGRGVPRDLARAYAWCDISLTNGYSEALFCRDNIALSLSAADLKRSTEFSSEFFRTHTFRN